MYNQILQANMMSNYQAELIRMNYFSNMDYLNTNLYAPELYMPMTENSIVDTLDNFFSIKNLNRDLNLRKNMDEETGNVPIDFILNLNKIRSIQLTEDKISQFIDSVGSDKIEKVIIDNKLYLRPKHYVEEIKDKLISIEEIENKQNEKMNLQKQQQQEGQQNIPMNTMNIQPIPFYPVQPFMYYGQMMMPMQPAQNGQGNTFPLPNVGGNINK